MFWIIKTSAAVMQKFMIHCKHVITLQSSFPRQVSWRVNIGAKKESLKLLIFLKKGVLFIFGCQVDRQKNGYFCINGIVHPKIAKSLILCSPLWL